jgi:hypothetical protein
MVYLGIKRGKILKWVLKYGERLQTRYFGLRISASGRPL